MNIRSLHKSFEGLVNFLEMLNFEFNVISIKETWRTDNVENKVIYKLPNYSSIYQTRSSGKNGGILAIYFHETVTYTVKMDLSINSNDIEALCLEIINREGKNILISAQYKHPAGKYNDSEEYLNKFLTGLKVTTK